MDECKGLPLVHFSTQPEPFLSLKPPNRLCISPRKCSHRADKWTSLSPCKTELLIQLDGLAKGEELVFLLAATNLPWELDPAMLRRLEKRILVPLPNETARLRMIERQGRTFLHFQLYLILPALPDTSTRPLLS